MFIVVQKPHMHSVKPIMSVHESWYSTDDQLITQSKMFEYVQMRDNSTPACFKVEHCIQLNVHNPLLRPAMAKIPQLA